MNHSNRYILQDTKDSRLYLIGIKEENNYPIFTANKKNAAVYDEHAARIFSKTYKLNMIKV